MTSRLKSLADDRAKPLACKHKQRFESQIFSHSPPYILLTHCKRFQITRRALTYLFTRSSVLTPPVVQWSVAMYGRMLGEREPNSPFARCARHGGTRMSFATRKMSTSKPISNSHFQPVAVVYHGKHKRQIRFRRNARVSIEKSVELPADGHVTN